MEGFLPGKRRWPVISAWQADLSVRPTTRSRSTGARIWRSQRTSAGASRLRLPLQRWPTETPDAVERDRARAAGDRPAPLRHVPTQSGSGARTARIASKAHGEPLGEDELVLTKQRSGWPESPAFLVPGRVRQEFAKAVNPQPPPSRWWRAQEQPLLSPATYYLRRGRAGAGGAGGGRDGGGADPRRRRQARLGFAVEDGELAS